MRLLLFFALLMAGMTAVLCGCGESSQTRNNHEAVTADQPVQEKYAGLAVRKLVLISPHNTDIEKEYARAFSLYHAKKYGETVDMEWRDVGGGGSAVLFHLRNVYGAGDTAGIDVVWGGGEYNFTQMAREGILQPMAISKGALAGIPATFSGLEMVDKDRYWCGTAVSGFGFLYNRTLLARLKRPFPEKWDDLGAPSFYDLVGLADPTQSGSAAASYEMIVQSAGGWAAGWAKLLNIMGNCKKFYGSAGDAAEAIPIGEVAVSTCIDFYGINRVAKYPESLAYVSPRGETCFNPDPIAILKNPPHPEMAQRLVDFVLSIKGQALWALPPGHPDGPASAALGRQPIRKDVYDIYAGQLLPMIINPYEGDRRMEVDKALWGQTFGLLRQLVYAAAVKNLDGLKAAKQALIRSGFDGEKLFEFNRLPANINTLDKVTETDALLRDKKERDIIVTDWVAFFAAKYEKVAR